MILYIFVKRTSRRMIEKKMEEERGGMNVSTAGPLFGCSGKHAIPRVYCAVLATLGINTDGGSDAQSAQV